jgi:hypothetical protein
MTQQNEINVDLIETLSLIGIACIVGIVVVFVSLHLIASYHLFGYNCRPDFQIVNNMSCDTCSGTCRPYVELLDCDDYPGQERCPPPYKNPYYDTNYF